MAEIKVERRGWSLWMKALGLLALLLLIWLAARALRDPETTTGEPVPIGMMGTPIRHHGG